jgi:hypothetical protein
MKTAQRPALPVLTKQGAQFELSDAARTSVLAWLEHYNVVNEKGEPIDFRRHMFLEAIYEDQSQYLVVKKAAQIGMSTLEVLKNVRDAQIRRMDIIYTLPTDADVNVFVGGKVNRILSSNPPLSALTEDSDSIEKKQIGKSMLYFRGTWTKKSAIMVTADRLVHDEKDSSRQEVIADYQARLQHSKMKQIHSFSHPSVPNSGVDVEWKESDQKEWFITCPHCDKQQILTWNTEDPARMSVDLAAKEFVCKKCRRVLDWKARAKGEWRQKKGLEGAKWSGYHISLLMAPWVTAAEIAEKYNAVIEGKQTMDFFFNKVLGEPYAGGGNSVTEDMVMGLITKERNIYEGRIVIGVDTGVKLRYVIGNKQGLLGYGEVSAYVPDAQLGIPLDQSLEYFLKKFPESIMVVDQGGDIVGSRQLRAKYPGRVFLCHYARDRKTMELFRWGTKDEFGNVLVDRNRAMQLVIDEMRDKRFALYNGDKNSWWDYYLHWSHIYRITEEDSLGVKRYAWLRSDRDDWVHATVYWRVGVSRFGGRGGIYMPQTESPDNSYVVNPDQTVEFSPDKMFGSRTPQNEPTEQPWWAEEDELDWRDVD